MCAPRRGLRRRAAGGTAPPWRWSASARARRSPRPDRTSRPAPAAEAGRRRGPRRTGRARSARAAGGARARPFREAVRSRPSWRLKSLTRARIPRVLALLGLVVSIALADSINPSTIVPALFLATGSRPRAAVTAFAAGVLVVAF